MIYSMTGYGRAKQGDTTIEIRAVNHRYLDINIRLPRILSFLEEPLREFTSGKLSRGKVDIVYFAENLSAASNQMTLNRSAVEDYLGLAKVLEDEYDIRNDMSTSKLLRFPEAVVFAPREIDQEAAVAEALELAAGATEDFILSRKREGERLEADILQKSANIRELTKQIAVRMPLVIENYKAKMFSKISQLLENKAIDESRILTEAALFADKTDIDEELVRLGSHIGELEGLLKTGGVIGRKLDFLIQEFGREANTIGSKCTDTEATKLTLELKSEIEKIREQVQNIE